MKLPGNMQGMMKQAQQMQQRMQEEIEKITAEGTAGGGMVTVKMDGHKRVLGVTIDKEAAGDAEMLQDMVLAAVNEGIRAAQERAEAKMGGIAGGGMGGLGLPGM